MTEDLKRLYILPDGITVPVAFSRSNKLRTWFRSGFWDAVQGLAPYKSPEALEELESLQGMMAVKAYQGGFKIGQGYVEQTSPLRNYPFEQLPLTLTCPLCAKPPRTQTGKLTGTAYTLECTCLGKHAWEVKFKAMTVARYFLDLNYAAVLQTIQTASERLAFFRQNYVQGNYSFAGDDMAALRQLEEDSAPYRERLNQAYLEQIRLLGQYEILGDRRTPTILELLGTTDWVNATYVRLLEALKVRSLYGIIYQLELLIKQALPALPSAAIAEQIEQRQEQIKAYPLGALAALAADEMEGKVEIAEYGESEAGRRLIAYLFLLTVTSPPQPRAAALTSQ